MITEAYRVLRIRGIPTLLCLVCDSWSTHPQDILHKYCWNCNLFIGELDENYRRPPRTTRNLPGWHAPPETEPDPHRSPEGA